MTATANASSVQITWSDPLDANGIIQSYTVVLLSFDGSMLQNESVSTLQQSFADLTPFTNYSASVRALTDGGAIAGSLATVDFTTAVGCALDKVLYILIALVAMSFCKSFLAICKYIILCIKCVSVLACDNHMTIT